MKNSCGASEGNTVGDAATVAQGVNPARPVLKSKLCQISNTHSSAGLSKSDCQSQARVIVPDALAVLGEEIESSEATRIRKANLI